LTPGADEVAAKSAAPTWHRLCSTTAPRSAFDAVDALTITMVIFLCRCPTTGLRVQGRIADDPTEGEAERFEAATCLVCTRIHLVTPDRKGFWMIEQRLPRVGTINSRALNASAFDFDQSSMCRDR
jgi:hypothetical protein